MDVKMDLHIIAKKKSWSFQTKKYSEWYKKNFVILGPAKSGKTSLIFETIQKIAQFTEQCSMIVVFCLPENSKMYEAIVGTLCVHDLKIFADFIANVNTIKPKSSMFIVVDGNFTNFDVTLNTTANVYYVVSMEVSVQQTKNIFSRWKCTQRKFERFLFTQPQPVWFAQASYLTWMNNSQELYGNFVKCDAEASMQRTLAHLAQPFQFALLTCKESKKLNRVFVVQYAMKQHLKLRAHVVRAKCSNINNFLLPIVQAPNSDVIAATMHLESECID